MLVGDSVRTGVSCCCDCGLRCVMGDGPTSEEWPSSLFQVSRLSWSRLSLRLEVDELSGGGKWLALCQQFRQLPQDCPYVSLSPHVSHWGADRVHASGSGPDEDETGAAGRPGS